MGADFYASGLIGCEVTSKTDVVTMKSACAHNPPQTKKFCDECGKPTTLVETKTPLPGLEAAVKAAGLSFAATTDGAREFIGLKAGSTDDATCTRIPDDIKDWGIQFCSY